MARFITKVDIEPLENLWFRLNNDLIFEFTIREILTSFKPLLKEYISKGLDIDSPIYAIAPAGFVTDLASVPLPLTGIIPRDGVYTPAAIIHDIIYQTIKNNELVGVGETAAEYLNNNHNRYIADRIFLVGMRSLGVGSVLRGAMYNAVRAGGGSSYGINPMPENYGLKETIRYEMADDYRVFRSRVEPSHDKSLYSDGLELKPNAIYVKHNNLKRAFVYYLN